MSLGQMRHRVLLQTVAATKIKGAARAAVAVTYASVKAFIERTSGWDRALESHTEHEAEFKATIHRRADVREGDRVQGDGAAWNPLRDEAARIVKIVGTPGEQDMTLYLNLIR